MPCEFPLEKYIRLLDKTSVFSQGICCYDGPDSCTISFPAGARYTVKPVGDPPNADYRPLYGVCGAPTDRFALYTSGLGGQNGETIPVIEFQIRAGIGCISTVVFAGTFTPADLDVCDLVVQVTAPLATNWEIWARSPNADVPFTWKLLAALDRAGLQCEQFCLGPLTAQTFPVPPP